MRWCWMEKETIPSPRAARERARVVQLKGGFKAQKWRKIKQHASEKRLSIRNNEQRNGTTGSKRERGLAQLKSDCSRGHNRESDIMRKHAHEQTSPISAAIDIGTSIKIIYFRADKYFFWRNKMTFASVKSEMHPEMHFFFYKGRNADFLYLCGARPILWMSETRPQTPLLLSFGGDARGRGRAAKVYFDRRELKLQLHKWQQITLWAVEADKRLI